ncbi:MAG TPA: universal stress protein [Bacteroidetes bacterium]|nr:universal stress protein [Bacteroidota bacterium]
MKSANQDMEVLERPAIQPYKIKQAMGGLEMGPSDEPLLKYVGFFSGLIPVEAAYFLHVVPNFDLFLSLYSKETRALAGQYILNENLRQRMKEMIARNVPKENKIDIEYDVREGNPLTELLLDAKETNADLVVIGKKGKHENHAILAKNLVRKVKCNALVVPNAATHSLKKILVPIDFSKHSINALQTAIAINKQLKEPAEIICLNIYDMPDIASFKLSKTREQFRHMIEEDRMLAFDAFLNTYAHGEQVKKVLVQKEMPRTPHYIMEYASENEIDFMVMGAKGHSKVELLFMGSVTEKLLTINNSIPTLIVKKKY